MMVESCGEVVDALVHVHQAPAFSIWGFDAIWLTSSPTVFSSASRSSASTAPASGPAPAVRGRRRTRRNWNEEHVFVQAATVDNHQPGGTQDAFGDRGQRAVWLKSSETVGVRPVLETMMVRQHRPGPVIVNDIGHIHL